MGLFTTHLEKEGYQYPILIDTGASLNAIKPGTKGKEWIPNNLLLRALYERSSRPVGLGYSNSD
jgi:hypothetical protein